ncbi:MAG: FtsX-like permease family protein, partial [Peptostreptococcaceae bacterium]
ISTIIPIVRISKISPMESLKNEGDIKSKIRRINSKKIRKLFGYDIELAYKNIRGNYKTFLITTITSVIILTTFIVFMTYSKNTINEYTKEMNEKNDISLDINIDEDEDIKESIGKSKKYIRDMENLGVIKSISSRINYNLSGTFHNIKLNNNLINLHYDKGNTIKDENGKISIDNSKINLLVLDDFGISNILPYVGDKTLDIEDFNKHGVLMLNVSTIKNLNSISYKSLFDINKGEEFILEIHQSNNSDYDTDQALKDNYKLKLKYLGSVNPDKVYDSGRYGLNYSPTLIVSERFIEENKEIFSGKESYLKPYEVNMAINLKDTNNNIALNKLEDYFDYIEGYYIDNKSSDMYFLNELKLSVSLICLVLFLIVTIGGINMINNKYISTMLRKKEIGTMLAMGIKKKRLKKIFLLEGVIQWVISCTISIILSYIILKVISIIVIISSNVDIGNISIPQIIIGCTILFFINVIGSYLPIRKLEYSNTTELIRSNE